MTRLPFIVLCFFVLRLLVLFTGVELTTHYDELDLGTLAKEIVQGLKLPYRDYQLDFYSGESLILGAAVIPFFKLLGMNLLAIKMVPLLFSFLTLLVSYFFLCRYFGQQTARRGAWLLVLCPAAFVQLSLVGMSGHSEALFWSVAAVFAFYEAVILREAKPPRGSWTFRMTWLFVFGLFSGFGIWFYYANAIMVLVCLLSWLVLDRKSFFSKYFFVFCAGFFIGFSPWLYSHAGKLSLEQAFFTSHFGRPDFGHPLIHGIRKTLKLFGAGIPISFVIHEAMGVPERVLSYGYWLAAFLPALLWGLKRLEPKILPLAAFCPAFCFIYAFAHFDIEPHLGFVGHRYLTPVLFWGMILFAVMIGKTGGAGKKLGYLALVLGLVSQSGLAFHESAGRGFHYQGFSYYQLGSRWQGLSHRIQSFEDLEKLAGAWSPRERYFFFWGLSDAGIWSDSGSLFEGKVNVEDFLNRGLDQNSRYFSEWAGAAAPAETLDESAGQAASVPESRRDYYWKGWLDWWWEIFSVRHCSDCAEKVPESVRPWLYRNLGKSFYTRMVDDRYSYYWRDLFYLFRNDLKKSDLEKFFRQVRHLEKQELQWIYQGMGRARFTQGFDLNIPIPRPLETLLKAIPSEHRADVFWGMGWGAREMFREDPARAQDWIHALPDEGRSSALEGMHSFERWYRVPA